MTRWIVTIVSVVLLLHVANNGMRRTPTFAFWKSSQAFSAGLVCYSENVLVNLEEYRARSVASLKAYKERNHQGVKCSSGIDDVSRKMTAAEAFSISCLDLAKEQRDIYESFTRQKFSFNKVLVPCPEHENTRTSTGASK